MKNKFEIGDRVRYRGMRRFGVVEVLFGNECFVLWDKKYHMWVSSNWYDSDWNFRKQIITDSSKISSDLIGFPLLISIYDIGLHDSTLTNGNDILFTKSDGITKLPHEIQYFDKTYNSTHAQLIAWVKTDLSSSIGTSIYLYYNNSAAADQQNITGVWDDNYDVVQHLGETSGEYSSLFYII